MKISENYFLLYSKIIKIDDGVPSIDLVPETFISSDLKTLNKDLEDNFFIDNLFTQQLKNSIYNLNIDSDPDFYVCCNSISTLDIHCTGNIIYNKPVKIDNREEYLKKFNNEVLYASYQKIIELIEESKNVDDIYYAYNYNIPLFKYIIDINDIIKLLYNNLPITNFSSFKTLLKNYIEEKLNNDFHDNIDNNFDKYYKFYRTTKLNMLEFFNEYKDSKELIAARYFREKESPLFNLQINWLNKEAESIIFNNKTYKFNYSYIDTDEKRESLHFWRLNEENIWERLTFVKSDHFCQDILDPNFDLHDFYLWKANDPGPLTINSKGKTTLYKIL